jgi:energy-coupling factor transport system substrate-specific component
LYPFFLPALDAAAGERRSGEAPLLLSLLIGICLVAVLLEVQVQAAGAKLIALIGVLVSINAILRFAEVAIPGPGGFSPIFFLVIVTGYVYGGGFGFLMGAMTLLASALITGGVGPWLPYQMYTAGWVGMAAPLARPVVRLLRAEGTWWEVLVLALYGAVSAVVFGLIINLWFWPYAIGPTEQHWQAGLGWLEGVKRYLVFYAATSLFWDLMRVAGNVLLILGFGLPTLKALRRFRKRFAFSYQPAPVGVE